jgi:hypothetical protein
MQLIAGGNCVRITRLPALYAMRFLRGKKTHEAVHITTGPPLLRVRPGNQATQLP